MPNIKLKQYIGINSVTLKFHNNTDWTETEFNNFTSVLRNNYREIIDEEILEISIDKNYLTISKIANILNYCTTNNYSNINHIWENKESLFNQVIQNLFDINLEFDVTNFQFSIFALKSDVNRLSKLTTFSGNSIFNFCVKTFGNSPVLVFRV